MRHLLLLMFLVGCAGSATDDKVDDTAGTPSGDDDDDTTVGDDDDDTTSVVDEDPCVPPGDPTLEIGLGLSGFEPLPEGEPFPLIHGPQGGYHLEVGLRATNLVQDAGFLQAVMIARVDGMTEDAVSYPYVDLRCVRDYRESYGSLLVFPDPAVNTPDFLDGKEVEIEVSVTDDAGTVVVTTSTYVIQDTE